ncbi:MAG TPA: Smr/MutS family protein [Candidatus Paceibacterota bacterium]|nr:Smr/MutS family protein [Candidatus Paceibacterota bacterium]
MNKYQRFNSPEEEIDYHLFGPGVTREEIELYTQSNLEDFKEEGLKIVRLVTGRGLHSPHGPIIRPMVLAYLEKLMTKGEIKSYAYEKSMNGPNEGSIIVHL